MGAVSRARARGAGPAGGAGRHADRASVRFSPRRAVARCACGRARSRLGSRAGARSRLHHRRPADAPSRRAAAPPARRALAAADLRDPRQPRLRGRARSASEGVEPARAEPCAALARRRRVARPARSQRVDRRRGPGRLAEEGSELALSRRGLSHPPVHTSRARSTVSSRAGSSSCSAGHMHDGQIAIPYPGGKLRLAHPSARFANGVYRTRAAVMHVSPGLGTTFVPFRFAARPEVTELVLRSA